MRRDISGKRFGRLAVKSYSHTTVTPSGHKVDYWVCICQCGNTKTIGRTSLPQYTSCGCIQEEKKYENQKKVWLRNYKSNANIKGVEFSLTDSEFFNLVTQNCHYCGNEPTRERNKRNKKFKRLFLCNGIDRKDCNIGYTLDNCVPCCEQCNRAKLDYPYEEFISYLHRVHKFLQLKEENF